MTSPADSKTLALIGVEAEVLQPDIYSMRQTIPEWSITVHNKSNQSASYTNICSKTVLEKIASSGDWNTVKKVTSGLIVVAREKNKDNPNTEGAAYMVVPAHLVLTSEQCTDAAVAESDISAVREKVESRTTKCRYVVENDGHFLDLLHPPLLAYRHWCILEDNHKTAESKEAVKSEGEVFMSVQSCMNDIALLRLTDHKAMDLSEKQQVFPISIERHLDLLVSRQQRVVVGAAEGRLTPCARSVGSDDKHYGLHLAFILTSKDSSGNVQ